MAATNESSDNQKVRLIDCDHESVTIAWPVKLNIKSYELSMRTNDSDTWTVLSDKLQSNLTRKKNLSSSNRYIFRVRTVLHGGLVDEDTVFLSAPVAPLSANCRQCGAPKMVKRDASSVTVGWEEVDGATGYQIQYRAVKLGQNLSEEEYENNLKWIIIGSQISGKTVRKKNLQHGFSYYFKVTPVIVASVFSGTSAIDSTQNNDWTASPSSEAISVAVLAPNIKQFMPTSLVTSTDGSLVTTADYLAGKVIGIYFSAHWCGPCRQFTPNLVNVYHQAKQAGLDFEVVFCSADHSDGDFENYFKSSMKNSWAAIPYDEPEREQIQGLFQVNGIPRLVILSATTGRIIVDNAIQQGGISVQTIAKWIADDKASTTK